MFNPIFNPEFNILTKALTKAGFFVLAAGVFAASPSAGAGLPEDLTPSEKRAWAMKILKARLEKGGSESDVIQKGWLQMKLAHIAFSGESLMTEEASSALSGLGEMAAELVPEAQRELFKMASRKEAPFAARLGALEILLESQKAGNFSDELARFEALEAARAHLEIKSSERESRLTALLFDIVSGLSEPSPQLQEGLALLAISKNPYQKSLPRAALEVLSRSGYDETIALRLARGLESLIVPSKMQMLIAEELAEKHFPLIESFLAQKFIQGEGGRQEYAGLSDLNAAALRKAKAALQGENGQALVAALGISGVGLFFLGGFASMILQDSNLFWASVIGGPAAFAAALALTSPEAIEKEKQKRAAAAGSPTIPRAAGLHKREGSLGEGKTGETPEKWRWLAERKASLSEAESLASACRKAVL